MAGIITEAVQELNLLKEEAFEGNKSGLEKMADFLDDDMLDDTQEVIAPDAETEDDLEDSYVGKVIFKCPRCRTLVYHDKENIEFDEDSDVVNISDECPYCHTVGGFEIVGEVVPYADVNVKVDDEGEVETEDKAEDEAETEAEDTSESLKEAYKPEHVIKGNPTITWKSEDEDRYIDGECGDDFEDQAAFAAYLANSAGEKVYAFGGFDDDDGGMWLDIDGDGTFQKYIFSRGGLYSIGESLTEARDLTKTPGTIAKLLNDHMDEINAAASSVFALKAKLKEIVNNSDLADKPAAQKFNAVMDSKKNVNALLSTIATYMTGMKSEAVDKCPKCGKKPCECEDNLQEDLGSWIAARKLKKLEKGGKAGLSDEEKKNFDLKRKEYQARAQRGAKKADPITGKKANWTQKNLDKANELKKASSAALGKETKQKKELQRTRDELLKKWGLKDLDELKKALASAHLSLGEALRMEDDKLTEAFEKVELETATEKIKVESEPREDKTEEETIKPLTPEDAEQIVDINEPEDVEIDIDEFDEDELGELGESYLKRVYENVNSFKISSGKLNGDKLIVEGLITFNSGKTLNTSFQFSPSAITKSGKVKLIGENLGITKRKGAFTLSGKLDGKKLISESLTYNYSAKANKDAKAQRVYGRVTVKK